LELKASGLRGNGSFFNIVSKVLLEIEVPYLLAMGKFIGAQMSEIVADGEQRSVESHARIALSFYPYFDSEDRSRTFDLISPGHASEDKTSQSVKPDYRWYRWPELSRSYECRTHQPGWKAVTNDWNFWQIFGKSFFLEEAQ